MTWLFAKAVGLPELMLRMAAAWRASTETILPATTR